MGATGSGKTTLVQLIPRLYNAPPDSLFIDGVPIERIPVETLRRAIGFIPQDTFLFGETIRENIAFGVESAADNQIQRAAEISNIDPDVQGFPNKYQTLVGERGITLSGGQKQRTAISRAVVRDPKILILDDALSSVDTYTEEQILRELKDVMRDRTSILISHRVSRSALPARRPSTSSPPPRQLQPAAPVPPARCSSVVPCASQPPIVPTNPVISWPLVVWSDRTPRRY